MVCFVRALLAAAGERENCDGAFIAVLRGFHYVKECSERYFNIVYKVS